MTESSVLYSNRTKKLMGLALNEKNEKGEQLEPICVNEPTNQASEEETEIVKASSHPNNDTLLLEDSAKSASICEKEVKFIQEHPGPINNILLQKDGLIDGSFNSIPITVEYLQGLTQEEFQSIPIIIEESSIEIHLNGTNPLENINESVDCANDALLANETESSTTLGLVNGAENVVSADEILVVHNNTPSIQTEANNFNQDNENSKEKKKKKPTKIDEIRKQTKNRVKGKDYISYKRVDTKVMGTTKKEERKLKVRCNHTIKSKKSKRSFLCGTISEEKRQEIFNYFWQELMSWQEKRTYVKALVSSRKILKRRSESKLKTVKLEGHDIMLENDSREKVRVCRKFFLNTLDLGEDSFKRWTSRLETIIDSEEESDNSSVDNVDEKTEVNDEETFHQGVKSRMRNLIKEKKTQRLKKKEEKKKEKVPNVRQIMTGQKRQTLEEWLTLIPKVPSHYCRASSSKIYVESTFKSWNHMFKIYKKWCIENERKFFGRKQFTFILQKEKNIAIHKPRKDQCDTCSEYQVGNLLEEEYTSHVAKKERSRQAKRKICGEINDKELVITMDLQSVLLAPKTKASAMYYKQKLQVHDFSIYEINTKDVYLYVWHEVEGGVSSNEFTTCIIDYLSSRLEDGYEKIVLISDGCNYQNRNKVLASSLRDFSKKWSVEILQLILEKGHTQMEVDSVHATLESYFYAPINAPSDYVCRMRMARENQPYKIKVVDHEFFKNYSSLETNLTSLRPGYRVGDSCVTDIRQLLYLPNGDIKYNLDYDNESFKILEQRSKRISEKGQIEPGRLYNKKIPITESKYKQLQELKRVIDKDFHVFYDTLPFKIEGKKRNLEENSEDENTRGLKSNKAKKATKR